ncbi:MAG: hypothetical protein U1D66_00760, partial [Erythrobacter sp.]|nr:hypothetical protein [Erythrobacter sp.]
MRCAAIMGGPPLTARASARAIWVWRARPVRKSVRAEPVEALLFFEQRVMKKNSPQAGSGQTEIWINGKSRDS